METMLRRFFTAVLFTLISLPALAGEGRPSAWQMGFQKAATPVMEKITDVHNLLLIIIFSIAVFVVGLILFACWRFRASKNPTPSKVSHNTAIEIIWTLIPCLILIVIAIPSFKLLYYMDCGLYHLPHVPCALLLGHDSGVLPLLPISYRSLSARRCKN